LGSGPSPSWDKPCGGGKKKGKQKVGVEEGEGERRGGLWTPPTTAQRF